MPLLQAWILFPRCLPFSRWAGGFWSSGSAGTRPPGALLLPVGLAAVIVVARAAMWLDLTAELATPLVALGAVGGPRARVAASATAATRPLGGAGRPSWSSPCSRRRSF